MSATIIVIVKNQTDAAIYLNDIGGVEVPASGQVSLCGEADSTFGISGISFLERSDDLLDVISSEDVVINDGNQDLSRIDGIKWIVTGSYAPHDISNKPRMHVTPRKLGLTTYYASVGDDISDISATGTDIADDESDNILAIHHAADDDAIHHVYMDLNMVGELNETWVYEGYVQCLGARNDIVTFQIVPILSTGEAGAGTDYDLYGGYLVVPASGGPGTGTFSLTSDWTAPRGGLVYIPDNDLGNRPNSPCFWNADWDSDNNVYTNLTPAPYGNGYFNMFTVEVGMTRFVHKFVLLGDNGFRLDSYDTDRMGQGMRLKMSAKTRGDAHEWWLGAGLTMFRKHSK